MIDKIQNNRTRNKWINTSINQGEAKSWLAGENQNSGKWNREFKWGNQRSRSWIMYLINDNKKKETKLIKEIWDCSSNRIVMTKSLWLWERERESALNLTHKDEWETYKMARLRIKKVGVVSSLHSEARVRVAQIHLARDSRAAF